MREKLTFKQMIKKEEFESNHKVYCKCNHGTGVVFYNNDGVDRLICRNCGNFIYRDKKTELKYKLKEKGIKINEKKSIKGMG